MSLPFYLTEKMKFTSAIDLTAAGTSDTVSGAVLDTAKFEGTICLVKFGPIVSGATTTVTVAMSNTLTTGGALEDETEHYSQAIAHTQDEDWWYLDLKMPTKRYIRMDVTRADQNATIGGALYIQYGNGGSITQDTGTIDANTSIAPAEIE